MKSLLIAGLVAAQIMVAAQPAMAAELGDERGATSQRHGAFAGARLRLPLGGAADRKLRAGVTVAPIVQSADAGESRRIRFGEGLELGFAGRDKPVLAFGGRPVAQLAQGPAGPDGRKLGTSTTTGLLIVGGIVVLALGGVALLLMSQE
jgi:hypothetical protein